MKKVKGLFPTGQWTIKQTEKNKDLERKYNLRHQQKEEILKSLEADDCIDILQNEKPGFPDAEMFVFLKPVLLDHYGEPVDVKLYIKEYVMLDNYNMEMLIVVSFHEEGLYDF